jgi:glycosyltransferase involved in cell wall biosynthesis
LDLELSTQNLQISKVPTAPLVKASLIMTVRNEAESIGSLLRSLLTQSVRPAEIVVADGGSTDGTLEILRAYTELLPLRVIEVPGANISEGRNAAIRDAKYEIIAPTDAGVRLHPDWLRHLSEPFEYDPSIDVVSGFFVADPATPFERAMGATVLPTLEEIEPLSFLPSSRSVAFRKEIWEAAGGYPEWLDYCEDLVFDMEVRDRGARFHFAPEALVYFRPRSTLGTFFTQYYRYARGDGKANLWPLRHAVRYGTYILGPLVAILSLRHRRTLIGKAALVGLALAARAYLQRPYARLVPNLGGLSAREKFHALALVPLIRLTGDIAKMAGYPVGVAWRLRNHRASEALIPMAQAEQSGGISDSHTG